MYRWIWLHLPGPTAARAALSALLLAAVLAALFLVVFPWLAAQAPWEQVDIGLIIVPARV